MSEALNLSGQRAGLLTILRYAGSKKGKGALWECRCRCGATVIRTGNDLRRAQRIDPAFGCPACTPAARLAALKAAIAAACKEHGFQHEAYETSEVVLIRVHKGGRA